MTKKMLRHAVESAGKEKGGNGKKDGQVSLFFFSLLSHHYSLHSFYNSRFAYIFHSQKTLANFATLVLSACPSRLQTSGSSS